MNKKFEEAMKKLAELRTFCQDNEINLFATISDVDSFDSTFGGDMNEVAMDVILNIYRFNKHKLGETLTEALGAIEVTKIFTDHGLKLLEEKKKALDEGKIYE